MTRYDDGPIKFGSIRGIQKRRSVVFHYFLRSKQLQQLLVQGDIYCFVRIFEKT